MAVVYAEQREAHLSRKMRYLALAHPMLSRAILWQIVTNKLDVSVLFE